MKVVDIPFNAFLKIEEADSPSHLLQLQRSPSLLNHVGTMHAGAELALAEAGSGQLLMQALPELADTVVAVVRRVEAKYKKPMQSAIFARAVTTVDEIRRAAEVLATKGRALIPVTVEIVDGNGALGMVATFEWFAANREILVAPA